MDDTPFPIDRTPDEQPQDHPQVESSPPPARRRSLLRILADHNPFYLLSAACMLASLLALTNSLSWTSITRSRLITLIVTLNAYEFALLGIALFLIVRRGLRRDGRMLLILQAFFLADFGFLGAEIATADLRTGVAINAVLLALAALKIGVVLRTLKVSFTPLQFAFVVLQLAVLLGMPGVLRWLDGSRAILNARQFYVVWWVVGMLPAVYELLSRLDSGRIVRLTPNSQTAPTTAYLVLPFNSLLAHLGVLHWVYRVDFVGADAAPLLLGLTLVLNRFSPTTLLPRKDLTFLRLALPAAAVMVSWNDPFAFTFRVMHMSPSDATPTHLAVAGAFLVYVYCFLQDYWRIALASGLAAVLLYLFGPTPQQVARTTQTGWDWTTSTADRFSPKTPSDWGAIGVVASFALLALGLLVSLRKQPDEPGGDGLHEL
jgi:hypothetical protein